MVIVWQSSLLVYRYFEWLVPAVFGQNNFAFAFSLIQRLISLNLTYDNHYIWYMIDRERFTQIKKAPPSPPSLLSPLLPPSSLSLLPPSLPPSLSSQIPAGRRTERTHVSHQLSHWVWVSDWGTRTQDWTAQKTTQGEYKLCNVCVVESIHSLIVRYMAAGSSRHRLLKPGADWGPWVWLLATTSFFLNFCLIASNLCISSWGEVFEPFTHSLCSHTTILWLV